MVSYTHQVAAKGWFVAMVSTTVETANPEAEIKVGLDLLGPITQKWVLFKKFTPFNCILLEMYMQYFAL